MVKYIILNEDKNEYRHTIMRLGIFKHDAFIQERSYWYHDNGLNKETQSTFSLGLEALQKIREAN